MGHTDGDCRDFERSTSRIVADATLPSPETILELLGAITENVPALGRWCCFSLDDKDRTRFESGAANAHGHDALCIDANFCKPILRYLSHGDVQEEFAVILPARIGILGLSVRLEV